MGWQPAPSYNLRRKEVRSGKWDWPCWARPVSPRFNHPDKKERAHVL